MNSETAAKPVRPILRLLAGIEETVLCFLLLAMIVLSCLQIALRGLFSGGLLWADPLIQQMVLWSGLLGAALATSKGKHISLDVITYLVPERLLPWILVLTHLFSALTTTALVYAACLFLRNEVTYSRPGLFGLPSWAWNAIFPLAFLIITLRYYLAFFQAIGQLRQRYREGQR
jgi:TRAP-type C4-dicarboxylate transport system permease small subunit